MDLLRAPGEGQGAAEVAAARHVVTFRLAGENLALPVEQVAQVLPMLALTPLPESSGALVDSLLGVFDLHGRIVPVVDMGRHLGLPPVTLERDTPLLVTRAGSLMLGLVVDEVGDVRPLYSGDVIPASQALPSALGAVPALAGLVRLRGDGSGRLTLVLDADYLLAPEQRQALARAIEALRRQAAGEREAVP